MQLISFDRCPFVQRSIVTLEYKKVPYDITFIDPYDPPDWFKQLSPTGKVPILKLDDGTVLFESAVINEYLDEVTPGQLHPQDPVKKAFNRAWIEFGSQLLGQTFQLMTSDSEEAFNRVRSEMQSNLQRIEDEYGDGPYFNGADFSLLDAAYAPLFVRLDSVRELTGVDMLGDHPKLIAWYQALIKLDAVKAIIRPELKEKFMNMMRQRDAWILKAAA